MSAILINIVELLLVAIIVAVIARRLSLPYTVGLVLTGVVLALTRYKSDIVLTHDFIFDIVLPPLLFEAAINIHWQELRRDALPVFVLAIFGTIFAAAVVAAGLVLGLGSPLRPALIFGVLISATDPVAVIAMFKDNGVKGRLRLLVESESLFNDGVAAVLFSLVLVWAQASDGASIVPSEIALSILLSTGGGMLAGLVCAGVAIAVLGRTSDHLVEIALTMVTAYGSFLLAEHFGCSGVLSTVSAGIVMGNLTLRGDGDAGRISRSGREFVLAFWDFIAFVANSFVFLLIGLTVAGVSFGPLGWGDLLAVIGLVVLSRAMTVYPLSALFMRTRWRISAVDQHILWWGGLRGALGLALALSLPTTLPLRNEILVATFGVVVFSVVVQGLSMPLLLKWRKTRMLTAEKT